MGVVNQCFSYLSSSSDTNSFQDLRPFNHGVPQGFIVLDLLLFLKSTLKIIKCLTEVAHFTDDINFIQLEIAWDHSVWNFKHGFELSKQNCFTWKTV